MAGRAWEVVEAIEASHFPRLSHFAVTLINDDGLSLPGAGLIGGADAGCPLTQRSTPASRSAGRTCGIPRRRSIERAPRPKMKRHVGVVVVVVQILSVENYQQRTSLIPLSLPSRCATAMFPHITCIIVM